MQQKTVAVLQLCNIYDVYNQYISETSLWLNMKTQLIFLSQNVRIRFNLSPDIYLPNNLHVLSSHYKDKAKYPIV